MSAVFMDPTEEENLLTAAWKRIRALGQHLFELDGKVERLAGTINDIGKPLEMRGPDPDSEEQRYTQEEVRFLMGTVAQEARRSYGGIHKGGGGNAANHAWNAITIACVIGGVGLLWNKVDDHSKQLARIECQLSPASCLQLQVPHVP